MKNLREQNGCHNCLHAMEEECDDCGCPFNMVCMNGEPRPDTDGLSRYSGMFLSDDDQKNFFRKLVEWEKKHDVEPWSICDNFKSVESLSYPVKFVLRTDSRDKLVCLNSGLISVMNKKGGVAMDFVKLNLSHKLRALILTEVTPLFPFYSVCLSEEGYRALEQILATQMVLATKVADIDRIRLAKKVLDEFMMVKPGTKIMKREDFMKAVRAMADEDADPVCPFTDTPVMIDGTDCLQGSDSGYSKCCVCQWFGKGNQQ